MGVVVDIPRIQPDPRVYARVKKITSATGLVEMKELKDVLALVPPNLPAAALASELKIHPFAARTSIVEAHRFDHDLTDSSVTFGARPRPGTQSRLQAYTSQASSAASDTARRSRLADDSLPHSDAKSLVLSPSQFAEGSHGFGSSFGLTLSPSQAKRSKEKQAELRARFNDSFALMVHRELAVPKKGGATNEEIRQWLHEHVEDFGLPLLVPRLHHKDRPWL